MYKMKKYWYLPRFLLVKKNYKCFIGSLYHNNEIKILHIMLPKTSAYVKSYDRQMKWMYFLIKDDDLLEKYKTIWDKTSAGIRKIIWYRACLQ